MSSRKQREKNRRTAASLNHTVEHAAWLAHTCENCGTPGFHWTAMPRTLDDCFGAADGGFWTCPKYYDLITKRRIVI